MFSRIYKVVHAVADYTEGHSGNERAGSSSESSRDERHQVPERLAVGPTADCDLHGDEAIPDRSRHCDAIDSNVEASCQRYPGRRL